MRTRRRLTIFCVGAGLFFFLLPVIGRSGGPLRYGFRHWNPNTDVGTYKLVSLVIDIDGTPRQVMGNAPHGYLMITPTHFMTFFTSEDRQFGTNGTDKAALFNSLVGYAGVYRIEGNKIIHTYEASWVENLSGKTAVLNWELSGNRLTTTDGPRPWPFDPSKTMVNRRVWEKVE